MTPGWTLSRRKVQRTGGSRPPVLVLVLRLCLFLPDCGQIEPRHASLTLLSLSRPFAPNSYYDLSRPSRSFIRFSATIGARVAPSSGKAEWSLPLNVRFAQLSQSSFALVDPFFVLCLDVVPLVNHRLSSREAYFYLYLVSVVEIHAQRNERIAPFLDLAE